MSVADALLRGRTLAESRMTDTCRVTKPGTGGRVLNPVTRKYEDPPPVTVYEGSCRLGSAGQLAGVSAAVSGEATWETQDAILHLPVAGSEGIESGQTVEYLTSPFDQALVGRKYGVVGPGDLSQGTARRLLVRRAVR